MPYSQAFDSALCDIEQNPGRTDPFLLPMTRLAHFAGFKGDPATANWLPDETLAKSWKAKMGF